MKNQLFALLTLVILQAQMACNKSEKTSSIKESDYSGPPVKNDWMISWLSANPSTLNPILNTDGYGTQIFPLVFDTLLTWDTMTGKPTGRLAESWKISDTGLEYDFFLRKNAKFHDGHPVTAEDVKFSFDLIKNPKVDAAHIQNYFQSLKKVEVIGPYQVRFFLSESYFRHLIMLGLFEVLPKHIYGTGDFNTLPQNRAPVGSGPYILEKWDQGRSIELKRNPDYWGLSVPEWKDSYNFERIIFRIIMEESVAAMALKKGEIDILSPNPNQYVKDFVGPEFESKYYRLKYSTPDGNGFRFIGWNLQRKMFQSKKVRQALAMLLPREEINKKMYKALMTLAVGPLPQGSPKLDPSVKPIPYDQEAALKLLKEEGWTDSDGDGLLDKTGQAFKFEILFTAQSDEVERIALIYREALRRAGIQMDLKALEWTVFLKDITEGNFDSHMMAWGSSLDSDPYQIWHSSQSVKGGSNRIHYKNARVDEILTTARTTLDETKRNKLYQEFSRILADEAPYVFVFERPNLLVASKRFRGVLPIGILGPDGDKFFTPPGLELYGKSEAQ